MKTFASCPPCAQGDCTETSGRGGKEVKRLMPPSFIMTEAECRKLVEGYSFSAGRKDGREEGRKERRKRREKKTAKKEGGYTANRAIPPHTYLFHFSRHCQIFSPQMMSEMCPPVRRLSLSLCLCWISLLLLFFFALTLPLSIWGSSNVSSHPSSQLSLTHVRSLPPSLTLSLSLSLSHSISLSPTNTH